LSKIAAIRFCSGSEGNGISISETTSRVIPPIVAPLALCLKYGSFVLRTHLTQGFEKE